MIALKVSPALARFRQSSVLEANAEGLAAIQGSRTNLYAADELGWSESTVKNVRNRINGLSGELTWLAAYNTGGAFIAPHLTSLLGIRGVPLNATCTTDAGVQTELARVALKVAVALDPSSPGGAVTTAGEARAMLGDIDRLQAHMDRIRSLASVAA